ncbi:MAG: hypothetical protein WAT66_07655, partial [Actinomycetota bacterium]
AAPACIGGGDNDAGGDFRADRVVGSVTVQAPGQAPQALREGETIAAGTSFKTGPGARVRLESGSRAIELDQVTEATLLGTNKMSLELGRALAEVPGARTISFDSRGVTAQITGGAARLERKLGRVSIGVYSGSARIDLLGRGVEVPRLRQLDAAGTIATQREPAPLQLSPKDAWDREFLGDVIDFDSSLDQYARGFNAEFRTKATSPEFYFSFVAYRNTNYYETLQPLLDPADILIGTILGQQLAKRGGDLRAHVYAILRLHQLNATWGLIAKERGLDLRGLLRAVLDAISRGTAPPQTNNNASGGGPGPQPTPTQTSKPRGRRPNPSPSPAPTPTPTPTECSVLDRLLGTCDENQSSGAGGTSGSSSGSGCSVLGILIDPDC